MLTRQFSETSANKVAEPLERRASTPDWRRLQLASHFFQSFDAPMEADMKGRLLRY